jgi:hypothetical protein
MVANGAVGILVVCLAVALQLITNAYLEHVQPVLSRGNRYLYAVFYAGGFRFTKLRPLPTRVRTDGYMRLITF